MEDRHSVFLFEVFRTRLEESLHDLDNHSSIDFEHLIDFECPQLILSKAIPPFSELWHMWKYVLPNEHLDSVRGRERSPVLKVFADCYSDNEFQELETNTRILHRSRHFTCECCFTTGINHSFHASIGNNFIVLQELVNIKYCSIWKIAFTG